MKYCSGGLFLLTMGMGVNLQAQAPKTGTTVQTASMAGSTLPSKASTAKAADYYVVGAPRSVASLDLAFPAAAAGAESVEGWRGCYMPLRNAASCHSIEPAAAGSNVRFGEDGKLWIRLDPTTPAGTKVSREQRSGTAVLTVTYF
jgi:hypothetical protein